MENQIWTFGDSFTAGTLWDYNKWETNRDSYDGHIWSDKVPDFYKKYPGHKNWTTRISEHLDLPLMNRGSSGESPDGIFNLVIEHSVKFKKGDWVFIMDSSPFRFMGINETKKVIETINMEEIYGILDGVGWNYSMNGLLNSFSNLQPHKWKFWDNTSIGKETKAKLLIDYVSEFIANHPMVWCEYYIKRFSNLVMFLNNMGINAYFTWNGLWNQTFFDGEMKFGRPGDIFKTFYDEFDWGDDHFGYQGNIQFFEYLKYKINEKKFINPTEWEDRESIKDLVNLQKKIL